MTRDKRSPRSSRIRNEMDLEEPGVKIRCGLYKIEGHNSRNFPKMMEGNPPTPFLKEIKYEIYSFS